MKHICTAYETATLVAVIVKRSKEKRARISAKTLRMLGRRKNLRAAFILNVAEHLSSDFGLYMVELEFGSFAIVSAKSLESARAVTGSKWLSPEELQLVKKGQPLDWDALEDEASDVDDDDDADGVESD